MIRLVLEPRSPGVASHVVDGVVIAQIADPFGWSETLASFDQTTSGIKPIVSVPALTSLLRGKHTTAGNL